MMGRMDENVFGTVFNHRVVIRLLPFVLPDLRLVAVSTAAMLVYIGTQVAVPWMIKVGIDDYIRVGDFSGLSLIAAAFIGNAMLNWGSSFAEQLAIARVGQGILYRLRRALFAHLQRQSVAFYDKNEVGRLMSRVLGDVYQLQEFLAVAVVAIGDTLSLVGIVVALLLINVKLGLIAMVTLPVLVLIVTVWQPSAKRAFLRVRRAASSVNTSLNENVAGVRVVQSMNRQERNLKLFSIENQESLSSTLSATRLAAGLMPSVDMLSAISIGLVLIFGARLVGDEALEVGALVAFVLYIQRFFEPIRSLTMQYTQLQRAMASGVRIFEILDTESGLVEAPDIPDLPRLRGAIEFKNVSYGYVPGLDVLTDVNLSIKPGQTAAIVGPTGAGKTTLVSLATRFYDVERGRGSILVDGHDIRDASRKSLVSQTSIVLQEPFLFTGTVSENIKFGHGDATDERMVEAATAVGAHDFISRLENGYETLMYERGANLSVGQRQLVSFARAIVADPSILILDEATANIDSYTETLIQQALKKLLVGRTAIVIAHRLSTIRGADQIIVLNQGKVEEVGTHEELMGRPRLYAHLYAMNFAALKEALPGNGVGH